MIINSLSIHFFSKIMDYIESCYAIFNLSEDSE